MKAVFRIGFKTDPDPESKINTNSCEFVFCSGVTITEKVKFLKFLLALFLNFYLFSLQKRSKIYVRQIVGSKHSQEGIKKFGIV
jgi:hypothetical protein